MFYKKISNNVIRPVNCVEDVFFHFLGTQADESVILLKNIHRNREPKSENNRIVVFVTEKLALFPNSSVQQTHNSELFRLIVLKPIQGFVDSVCFRQMRVANEVTLNNWI